MKKIIKILALTLVIMASASCQNSNSILDPSAEISKFERFTFIDRGTIGFTSQTIKTTIVIENNGLFSYKEELMTDSSESAEVVSILTEWSETLSDSDLLNLANKIEATDLSNPDYPDITFPEDSSYGSCSEYGYTFKTLYLDYDVYDETEVEIEGAVVCNTDLIPTEINTMLTTIDTLIEKYEPDSSTM